MNSQEKIPSVLSYSPAPNGERQFGADISENAVTMMNFKLELEVQDRRLDELELTLQVLEGTNNLSFKHVKKTGGDPEYSYKPPSDIVTDYLTKVCERAWEVIGPVYRYSNKKPPVDIVVTVPVVRSIPYIASEDFVDFLDRNGPIKPQMRPSERSKRLASTKRLCQL